MVASTSCLLEDLARHNPCWWIPSYCSVILETFTTIFNSSVAAALFVRFCMNHLRHKCHVSKLSRNLQQSPKASQVDSGSSSDGIK